MHDWYTSHYRPLGVNNRVPDALWRGKSALYKCLHCRSCWGDRIKSVPHAASINRSLDLFNRYVTGVCTRYDNFDHKTSISAKFELFFWKIVIIYIKKGLLFGMICLVIAAQVTLTLSLNYVTTHRQLNQHVCLLYWLVQYNCTNKMSAEYWLDTWKVGSWALAGGLPFS